MDRSAQPRLARFALFTACAALPLAGLACDSSRNQADRRVADAISASRKEAVKKGGAAKAYETLKAVQEPNSSPAPRINVAALMAEADYAAGVALLPQLASTEATAARLIREIEAMGAHISDNNEAIAVCQGSNPAGQAADHPLKTLAAAQADFTKQLSSLDQRMGAMQSQIQAKQKDIAKVEAEKNAAANEATALLEKSDQVKGQQSMDLYSQGLSARSKATITGHALGFLNADLDRLQQTLGSLQQQRQAISEGIHVAQMQSDELTKAWKETQNLIAAQAAASKAMDSAPASKTDAGGVQARAKALASTLAEADSLRKRIDASFQAAADNYQKALHGSAELSAQSLQETQPLARQTLGGLTQLHSSTGYNLNKARAIQARGNLFVAQKDLLDAESRMIQAIVPIYRQAGLTLPPALNAAAANAARQQAAKDALAHVTEADTLLRDDVMERGLPAEKKQATPLRMGSLYSLYHLAPSQQQYLKDARELLKSLLPEAGEEGAAPTIALPALPDELEEGIIKRGGAGKPAAPAAPAVTGDAPATQPSAPAPASTEGSGLGRLLNRAAGAFVPGGAGPTTAPAEAPAEKN